MECRGVPWLGLGYKILLVLGREPPHRVKKRSESYGAVDKNSFQIPTSYAFVVDDYIWKEPW